MATEQLERSILERKERDELHAIAAAMALKPAARLKKADIIDLILTATGVGPEGESANGDAHNGNGGSPEGAEQVAEVPASTPRTRRSPRARAASAGTESTNTESDGAQSVTTESVTTESNGAPSNGAGPHDSAPNENAATTAGEGESRAATTSRGSWPAATASEAPGAGVTASTPANGTSHGAATNGADAGGESGSGAAPSATAGDAAEARSEDTPRGPNGQGRESRQQNQNHQGQQSQQNQQNQNQGGQLDAGNRRGRRRRGRDRERTEGAQGQPEAPYQGELITVKGLLDLRDEGYGFLRTSGYLASQRDVYVSVSQARRFSLRKGDAIEGACRPAGASEKYPALVRIDTIGGLSPDDARQRPRFEDLTPLFPDERLRLEMGPDPTNVTARIVDLISPIGKGQRGLIVSPPKAGKTTILKQIAHSIEANNPDVHLIVLLVDERPEEVTDMRRSVKGEVIASTFDRPADEHTSVAELTIERAKRLVELGKDVVIVLDGITRLARAYNLAQPATGRVMSGGVDSGALYPPKRFFGAARNIEEGGSLTILATALVETGSRMDEVIFEEFKGTGNMELRLDRKLSERRLYPAIDVNASSTRHEELLFDRGQLAQVWKLRRVLNALSSEGNVAAGLELLIDKLRQTRSNDEFLAEIAKAPVPNT